MPVAVGSGRRGAAALVFFIGACAASPPPPSARADPRSMPAAVTPATTLAAPRRFQPIGAGNAARVKLRWEAAAGGYGRAVAVSARLDRVAFSSGSPVRLYALQSGREVGEIDTCADVIRGGLFFVQDELIVVCESGLRSYVGLKPSKRKLKTASATITAAALAQSRLALGHHDGILRIYDLGGGSTLEIPVPGPPIDPKSLALSPDGSRIAVSWIQGSIWWWDVADPGSPHPLVRRENESDALAFSWDGAALAEEGRTFFTTVWDFSGTPAQRAEVRNGAWVKRIHFTRDGLWLIRGGSDGLELAEIAGPQRAALDTRGRVEDVATDEHGGVVAAGDRDGRLTVWSVP